MVGTVDVPVFARVHLAHAVVEHVARQAGADILHIKGPALAPGLRPAHRTSSDVDIIVRPIHLARLVAALESLGWEKRTDFATGSVFAHAANWWHDDWGWLDIHVHWPGIGISADAAFDVLAEGGATAEISHVTCRTPHRIAQILILVLHSARTPDDDEVDYAFRRASQDEQDAVRALALRLDAEVAFDSALGLLNDHRDHPAYDLWRHFRYGGSRNSLWRARIKAAPTASAKLTIATEALRVNRDHLRMELGREPTPADLRARQRVRLRRAVAEIRRRLTR